MLESVVAKCFMCDSPTEDSHMHDYVAPSGDNVRICDKCFAWVQSCVI